MSSSHQKILLCTSCSNQSDLSMAPCPVKASLTSLSSCQKQIGTECATSASIAQPTTSQLQQKQQQLQQQQRGQPRSALKTAGGSSRRTPQSRGCLRRKAASPPHPAHTQGCPTLQASWSSRGRGHIHMQPPPTIQASCRGHMQPPPMFSACSLCSSAATALPLSLILPMATLSKAVPPLAAVFLTAALQVRTGPCVWCSLTPPCHLCIILVTPCKQA